MVRLAAMFGFAEKSLADPDALYYLRTNLALFIAAVLFCLPVVRRIRARMMENGYLQAVLYAFSLVLLVVCTAFLVTQNYNPFLHFRF